MISARRKRLSQGQILRSIRIAGVTALFCTFASLRCSPIPPPPPPSDVTYANTTDPTNSGANYVGSQACIACHAAIGEHHQLHGHANALTGVQGQPPSFPDEAVRAVVPQPPAGFAWTDIAYLIGGYTRTAHFVDLSGFVLTDNSVGTNTQWNLAYPANGTQPGFVPFVTDMTDPLPFEFAEFQYITTGPEPLEPDFPEHQDNRAGIQGTWFEAGVQCEACHGPGSNHIPNPSARDLFVDSSATGCGKCHSRGANEDIIEAAGGYIRPHQQLPELLASGGHAGFACTFCHDPHRSVLYDDHADAIRNDCGDCHSNVNMALHSGFVFVRGEYNEPLTCMSCHMPFATSQATTAGTEIVGDLGKMGDTRTHVFRIDPGTIDSARIFPPDGSGVVRDESGRASLSLDFVCLRCHNGIGNAAAFTSPQILSDVARNMHEKFD